MAMMCPLRKAARSFIHELLRFTESVSNYLFSERFKVYMQKKQHVILGELVEDVDRLARHISIIEALKELQPAGIIKLSQVTDLPEHKVRYSLRVLEKNGVIKPSREGAVLTAAFTRSHKQIAENVQQISKDISSVLKRLMNVLREN